MMIKNVQKNIIFKDLHKELRVLAKTIDSTFNMKEVQLLTDLKGTYKNIFKRQTPTNKKLDLLLDCLMIGTSYYERLTFLKNNLIKQKKPLRFLTSRAVNFVYVQQGFLELKKQDKDVVREVLVSKFYLLAKELNDLIEITDNSLVNIDKLQFNLKSAIGVLRDRFMEENNERK